MKIAIVGCGAMGCVYAALFREAGHEVWAVDTWTAHVDALRENGLRLEGASGDRVVRDVHAVASTVDVGVCDLVVIATKAGDVAAAAVSVAPLLGGETPVITIQNGLGSGERIVQWIDSSRVIVGVAEAFGASVTAPGRAHHNSMKMIRLGEYGGGMTPRLARVTAVWREAGFNADAFEDIDKLVWEKFVCNVAFSAPCTVFRRTIGELMDDPASWHVAVSCATEADRAGRALGIAIGYDDPVQYVHDFGSRMPAARPSLYLDHLAGRRSEIDAINGMVPVVARQAGTEAPYNVVMAAAVRAREAGFG